MTRADELPADRRLGLRFDDPHQSWQLIQSDFHANQRAVVEAIAGHGGLRADLDVATAADILWTLNHPDVWLLLTDHRGWSPDRFERWLERAISEQLLGPAIPDPTHRV